MTSESFDFDGEFYRVEAATTRDSPITPPQIFFGGASPAAEQVAAEHVDVYLAWGEPPAMVAERLDRMRALAKDAGRTPDRPLALRHPVPRHHPRHRRGGVGRGGPTVGRAWTPRPSPPPGPTSSARRPRASAAWPSCPAAPRACPTTPATSRSTPTCGPASGWCAAAPARRSSAATPRSPTASPSTTTLGFDEFILSGYPHLEEAWRVGDGLLPELRRRGLLGPVATSSAATSSGSVSTFR